MGRWVRRGFLIASILLACSLVLTFVLTNEREISANSHYWADCYGFENATGQDSWSYYSYGGRIHSGIRYKWSASDPSTYLSLQTRGWPGSAYNMTVVYYANLYLPGNALFAFFGHGNIHYLDFFYYRQDHPYNGQLTGSFLLDYRPNDAGTLNNVKLWLEDPWANNQLDDLLFAGLVSCKSTNGDTHNSSIGSYMRCWQKVDVVLGFDQGFTDPGAHSFNERFYYYAVTCNWTCGSAVQQALTDTYNQTGFCGTNTAEIWSKDWNPNTWSNIRLGTPRNGEPG